jgi:tetratricopeptide (TPR) repeat protein
MRSRSFHFGLLWGWMAACCLSVSPALAQTALASSAPASSLIDSLYHDGLGALERKDWTRAVLSFENLQTLQPDYLDIRYQRALAWKKLRESRAAENAGLYGGRNRTILRIGLANVALLAIWGIVISWPHARACCRLWRGDDEGAAQVYEKILQRHPQRVQFYSPLADIYLLLGRNDARAIKVYKTVLQLNLAKAQREEINAMVTQSYLKTNQMDDDAIPVLEEALKAVSSPQPQNLPAPQRAGRQLAPRYA